jgi:hypothetical protein
MINRKLLIILTLLPILLLFNGQTKAQDSIQARIVLIGDAGDLKNGKHPVLQAVRQKAKLDKNTVIVYLGDNLYSTGLPDEQAPLYDIRRAILDSQVSIADKTDAKVYFLPGNHDWNRGHAGGWEAILREAAYVELLGGKNVKFLPEGGCGGPVEVPVSADVTLVIFDSQWWIHQHDKPGIESDCPYKTKTEILSQLEDILARNSKKLVVLACHHPFKSFGIHGGFFTLKQHIFPLTEMWPKLYIPLPVIGTVYPLARGVFGTPQDLKHPEYVNMINDIQKVAKQHPNLIFAAGHEHNLQYIKDSSYHYIVSGSGTKSTRVSKNKTAPFTSHLNGFAVLQVSKNKNVELAFHTTDKDSVSTPFRQNILNFSKIANPIADTINAKVIPGTKSINDSVVVAANVKYINASKGKKFFLGENYREEWATPVQLKVFNINKENGGYKIESLGGGKQTKSLRLRDKKGREWTLRTVNKDPEKAIPENLRGSLAQDIVEDMISAANPYAPLTIPPLANAAGIVVATPQVYFVPDDPAFGIYRSMFANTVCMLEEREPGSPAGETKSTAKVINKMLEDNEHHVDQEAVLNARLLDMLIADWDRHFDQWRFATKDTGKGKLYFPLPRDRDQAYFASDGFLLRRISKNLMPYLKGFRRTIPRVEWLAWEARDFDRLFMNNIDGEKWKEILNDFHANITDQVIDNAVKKLPPNVYAINGPAIAKTLKSRRDFLKKSAGMRYYNFLSREVDVIGSNKDEYFKISKDNKGLMNLSVYKRKANNDTGALMYTRSFKPSETKEVRLYGLNGDDYFDIADDVTANIRVRLIGGRGNDTFNVAGKNEKYVYDLNAEKNYIKNGRNAKNYMSDDPSVNQYDVTGYRYNYHRFPRINIGFNPEDKLMIGIGFLNRTYGFRKEPFATQNKLTTLYAINRGSYQVRYNGEFNQVIKQKHDLVANGEIVHPTLNNFFGLGNDTKNERDREYYRVRYNYAQAEILLRNRLFSVANFYIGPHIYHYWNRPEDNKNKILGNPSLTGFDSVSVYSTKTYLGGKLGLNIDNLNNDLLPTRGVLWNTEFSTQFGMNEQSNNLTRLITDLTLYSSLSYPAKVVSVLRLGGGRIYSKEYEYFQALSIGANNYLRGFRKNRFSGSGLAYGSLELRIKLLGSKSYIFPGDIGLIGFNDVGRVWVKNDQSKKWHYSYGGGLYYAAYNLALISATIGFSEEEKLFNFTIGTKFNITF